MSLFQQLHDSEINGRISSFFDSDWTAEIGDTMNGFKEQRSAESYAAAEIQLANMAVEHYPNSVFAKMYKNT